MYFLPDTPRWYYARNRWEEGDAALAQLNDADVASEKVQRTRREILASIEAELEANSSLHWKQFLTMGIVDNTRMKIVRRLSMCFWLPMIREWVCPDVASLSHEITADGRSCRWDHLLSHTTVSDAYNAARSNSDTT